MRELYECGVRCNCWSLSGDLVCGCCFSWLQFCSEYVCQKEVETAGCDLLVRCAKDKTWWWDNYDYQRIVLHIHTLFVLCAPSEHVEELGELRLDCLAERRGTSAFSPRSSVHGNRMCRKIGADSINASIWTPSTMLLTPSGVRVSNPAEGLLGVPSPS